MNEETAVQVLDLMTVGTTCFREADEMFTEKVGNKLSPELLLWSMNWLKVIDLLEAQAKILRSCLRS